MSIWFGLWLAAVIGIGLVWLVRYVGVGAVLCNRQRLTSGSYDEPPENAPKVSILVAAKDEQETIGNCIATLLEQDYPNFEVIAIDDRSTDRTAEILRDLARQQNGRMSNGKWRIANEVSAFDIQHSTFAIAPLRVITVHELREGWFGKNNAMREGVSASAGEWLLFTDADCRQISHKTLSTAMREALEGDVDFLSITPVLETHAVWERIIQPVCALALILWFLPQRVNDPTKKTAYANGAFMLMRRSCYLRIGGHERVRTEVNEDIHMARFTKRMGLKLRVVENDDLYRTRMYRTPAEAWRGWSRIFYGCLGTMRRLMISVLMVVFYTIVPWVSLVVALTGRALARTDSTAGWTMMIFAWLGVIVLQQMVLWRFYGIVRTGRVWSLTYVLGVFVLLGMLVSAMFKVIGATGTTWRGTTYNQRTEVHCLTD